MLKKKDLKIGKAYGRLRVQTYYREMDNRGNLRWMAWCDCDPDLGGCGKTGVVVSRTNLVQGFTLSCGCLRDARVREVHTTHGHSTGKASRTYNTWAAMKREAHKNEIPLEPAWEKFESFLKDMGEAPEQHRLSRINKPIGFVRDNVIWKAERTAASEQRQKQTT